MTRNTDSESNLPDEIQPIDELLRLIYDNPTLEPIVMGQGSSWTEEGNDGLEDLMAQGDRLGPYEVIKLLGIGGFGVVYQALHTTTRQMVALKLPRSDRTFSRSALRRFVREPKFLKKLDHPSIVALVDAGEIGDTF